MFARIPPVNGNGSDYLITHNGEQFQLARKSRKGRRNIVGMTTDQDAINIANALVDAVEQRALEQDNQ